MDGGSIPPISTSRCHRRGSESRGIPRICGPLRLFELGADLRFAHKAHADQERERQHSDPKQSPADDGDAGHEHPVTGWCECGVRERLIREPTERHGRQEPGDDHNDPGEYDDAGDDAPAG